MTTSSEFPVMRVMGSVRRLVIVLGDQLNRFAASFDDFDKERDAVLMMEVGEESTCVPSHRQRTVLFLSAMRHFAKELAGRGVRVHYVKLNDKENTQSFDGEVRRNVKGLKPQSTVCTHPGEWRILELMKLWTKTLDSEVQILPDRHFLVQPEQFADWAENRDSLIMEYFYREQRRKLKILVDEDGSPEGGKWNFDDENRKAFKSVPEIRRPYRARPDALSQEVIELVDSHLPTLPGRIESFNWPVTRTEAKRALKDFIDHRIANFGTYQDAMWTDEPNVYHSRLSTALNLKLLSPMECVDAAINSYRNGDAPMNAVEGFVRQVIGWREFIRGVYWYEGPDYANRNALECEGSLPNFYWTGETDMACLRSSIGQVLDGAYGHHIQRLMITGNFALLCGVHPKAVSDWYLGMFADGVDWATLPNTLGMALHADGGVVGTKPYAASGNYINRMSNYCKHCHFDVKQRTGDKACPFNALYWDFLIRHRERFRANNRMAMILKNVDRMAKSQRVEITKDARALRTQFGVQ